MTVTTPLDCTDGLCNGFQAPGGELKDLVLSIPGPPPQKCHSQENKRKYNSNPISLKQNPRPSIHYQQPKKAKEK